MNTSTDGLKLESLEEMERWSEMRKSPDRLTRNTAIGKLEDLLMANAEALLSTARRVHVLQMDLCAANDLCEHLRDKLAAAQAEIEKKNTKIELLEAAVIFAKGYMETTRKPLPTAPEQKD